MGMGQRERKEALDALLERNVWLELHTGFPGNDGQEDNMVVGDGLPLAMTASDWAAATSATPSVKVTSAELEIIDEAAEDYASGVVLPWGSAWKHETDRTEANYLGPVKASTARAIVAGNRAYFPAGSLSMSLGDDDAP